jgi:hypothetical protein
MELELINCTPPGPIHACHPSGWIQSDIFTGWFRHFICHIKPTAEDPVILVLDGHLSHSHNLEVINLGQENRVSIISLPPHSTHKVQPLDLAFMGPLKWYCAQEIKCWLHAHPGWVVTIYQVGELFGCAYMRAATAENAASGFRKAGPYPCNSNIFRPHEFLVAKKDSEQASIETPREPQPGISRDQVNINPVTAIDVYPLPTFSENHHKTNACAGSA